MQENKGHNRGVGKCSGCQVFLIMLMEYERKILFSCDLTIIVGLICAGYLSIPMKFEILYVKLGCL